MDIVERAKNILLTPKTEWLVIEGENESHDIVLKRYVWIIALIPAICSFIGCGLIGYSVFGVHIVGLELGIRQAILQYIICVGGVYLTAVVINVLAENFKARKNFGKAFQLVAYSYTATCVGGFFYIYHGLSVLAGLAGLYSLYLLYIGLKPMMKVDDGNETTYFVVSLLSMVLVYVVLGFVLASLFIGSIYTHV